MVYYTDTLECCHPLTEKGKIAYQEMLQKKADEILFKTQHPLQWQIMKLKNAFKSES